MLLEDEGGSNVVFTLFVIGNVAMAVTGLFTIAAGSYVLHEAGGFEWLSAAFVVFGVGLLLMSLIAFWSRRDANMLLLYVLATSVLLALQVAFTYAVVIGDSYDKIVGLDEAVVVKYVLIACCVLIFLCLLVGWWYRSSLLSVLNAQKQDEQLRAGLQKVTQATKAPLL